MQQRFDELTKVLPVGINTELIPGFITALKRYNDFAKKFTDQIERRSPAGEYSYPSVIQGKDGMVHIVYTWRRQKIKYVKVDPSKLEMTKIENGAWPKRAGYIAPKASEITTD